MNLDLNILETQDICGAADWIAIGFAAGVGAGLGYLVGAAIIT